MECRTHLIYFSLLALTTLFAYLFLANHYSTLLNPLDVRSLIKNGLFYVSIKNDSFVNHTIMPILETTSTTAKVELTFTPRLSEHYPRLPIHIYTQNVSLMINKTKLILLGNGFFGDRSWGLSLKNQTSTSKMISLYCPFLSNYCDITDDVNRFTEADAIVYHIRDGINKKLADEKRHLRQRLVFALWESPAHTPGLSSYRNFFNWTMSYRLNSHILTSYYSGNPYVHKSSAFYKIMLRENITRNLNLKVQHASDRPSDEILERKKLGVAAALISNCGGRSNRLEFIKQLQQYITVHVYGRCGKSCPSGINCREFIAQNYYFILSFENSLCVDYASTFSYLKLLSASNLMNMNAFPLLLAEKFFASIEYPVVPVVLGRVDYSSFIPSSAFIDTNEFSTMISLARYLNETRYNKEKYLSYFSWKKDYVWGLGQFFTPFCDLCLRLHLDNKPNVIEDIQKWWFDGSCYSRPIPK